MYRCELIVGGLTYRITDNLKNWDEIKASFKRSDYDGVVRSFSSKFEFAGSARALLLKQYEENYLNAAASIVISTRNNSWLYNERFNCALNFSTLSDDGHILSINAIDDSVASLIKAKKGTQYEYPVEELKELDQLYYDGIELNENVSWIPVSNSDAEETEAETVIVEFNKDYLPFPVYIESEDALIGTKLEYNDQGGFGSDDYMLKSWEEAKIDFEVNIGFWIYRQYIKSITGANIIVASGVSFKIIKILSGGSEEIIDELMWETSAESDAPAYKEWIKTYSISLKRDEKISILCKCVYEKASSVEGKWSFSYKVAASSRVKASWQNRIKPVMLDTIKPVTLLNRLLKSMNEDNDGLTGIIESDGSLRLDGTTRIGDFDIQSSCLILAAESARRLTGAKIYTSFTKFASWMSSVFGFVYDIDGKTVTFRHRSAYFTDKVVKRIDNYNDYEFKVNSSLVYSGLRIGYDKQDYDSVNGRDEFRFTNEYTSGINITDNTKEMISPYRADAYGIEFLANASKGDTTDDSSDTDVFFVQALSFPSLGRYILYRGSSLSGVISPNTMFNALYSPTSMIEANESFIGVSIKQLTFASSDGNSDVIIDGKAENRNISITGQLFTASEISLETSDIELPEDLAGIVEFEHEGEIKRGYYQQADYDYGKAQSSKITLIVKNG